MLHTFLGPPATIEEMLLKVGDEVAPVLNLSATEMRGAPGIGDRILFLVQTAQAAVSRVANFPHRDLSPAS